MGGTPMLRGSCGAKAGEVVGDLVDVAGAHRDEDVAGGELGAEVGGDVGEAGDVDGALAVVDDALDELAAGDALALSLGVADEVDVGDDRLVGGGEAGGEVVEEEARAAVLVGLEDAEQAARAV